MGGDGLSQAGHYRTAKGEQRMILFDVLQYNYKLEHKSINA